MPINLNGHVLPEDQPIFTAGNRAFHYGDGLFETIRVANGQALFIQCHWERLSAGLAWLHLEVPGFFGPVFFVNELKKLTYGQGNWRVRLSVWRSGGGLYSPDTHVPEFLIEATPLPSPYFDLNETGLSVGLYQSTLPIGTKGTRYKTASAIPYVQAAIYKNAQRLDDLMLLNTAGRLACGSSSNIFLAKNGTLFTPPLTEGCVAGTMRATLLTLVKNLGFSLEEASMEPGFAQGAEEIFLTNAIQGIRWVGKVDGFAKEYSKSISTRLVDALNMLPGNHSL